MTSATLPASITPRTRRGLGALLTVLLLAALYVARHLSRGWVPIDDGTLAQAAERVLQGQLPHRDFDDVYTGGLALWDAGALRLFGTSLLSLRLALFAVFLAWVPAVWYLASRVSSPVRAAFVTFLAVTWSLPNYNAAMPSWYNLFLATFALAALARQVETGRRRWLVAAGVAAGLSILVKVVGLYLVAAVLLHCVHEEQLAAQERAAGTERRTRAYSAFVTAGLAAFVVALGLLVRQEAGLSELVHFFLPGALLAAYLVHREWTQAAEPDGARWERLAALVGPFLAGVVLPVATFLVPYVRSGSVHALLNGVFVLPMRRFDIVALPLPPLYTTLAAIPLFALAWLARRFPRKAPWYVSAVVFALVATYVYQSGPHPPLYRFVWFSARGLLPLLVLAGVVVLSRPRAAERAVPALRRWTFLLLAGAALCSLVQFPFASPIYFAYVAPLVILAALMLLRYAEPLAPLVPRAVLALYMLFAMFRMNISMLTRMGRDHIPFASVPLALDRSGIRISRNESAIYGGIVPALRAHARGGVTWAGPDLPEIYFLSGLRNPTRAISEILSSQGTRRDEVLHMLDANGITAIVINQNAYYSHPLSAALQHDLEQRFPFTESYGPLELRWRT